MIHHKELGMYYTKYNNTMAVIDRASPLAMTINDKRVNSAADSASIKIDTSNTVGVSVVRKLGWFGTDGGKLLEGLGAIAKLVMIFNGQRVADPVSGAIVYLVVVNNGIARYYIKS
jgi:hypothetical protein